MIINLSKITNKKVYLLIAVMSLLLYGNSINNEYALDDDMVVDNILVSHGIKAIPRIFKSRYAVGKQEYEYRPMVTSSFALEKQFFGRLPASQSKKEKEKNNLLTQANISHFINLLLYILTCMLLYSLLQNIFKEYNVLLPLLITILFLIHPLHTEAVANIKSRDELFVLLGIIISLKLYLKYTVTNQLKYAGFAMIFVLFAILSKKNAIAALGLVPVVLYFVKADYKKILISTGGSGGHVIPATIIYKHLEGNFDVSMTSDFRGVKFLNKDEYNLKIFNVRPISKNILIIPLDFIFMIFLIFKSISFLRKNKIDTLISTGGYMSLPLCLGAKILNIKLLLFEPNMVLGRSNKFFISYCQKIFCYSNNVKKFPIKFLNKIKVCLLYTSPSPRDRG